MIEVIYQVTISLYKGLCTPFLGLLLIGEVIHLAGSGRFVVKLFEAGFRVRSGEILYDESGRRTGKVIETIGPVSAPYASVLPLIDRPKKAVGAKLFSGNAKHVKVTRRRNFGKKRISSRKPNRAI
jgi:rRNA processing protein Gar1